MQYSNMRKVIGSGLITLDVLFMFSLPPALAYEKFSKDLTTRFNFSHPTIKNELLNGIKTQPLKLITQATKTRKIVVNEFGYSFDVPTWARVIKDGSRGEVNLEVLKEKYYEHRRSGITQLGCVFDQETNLTGCAEFYISIRVNGRRELARSHKELTTVCYCDYITGANVYKGTITVNGRTYRKYETGDEGVLYNIYLYLTKKNHLVTIVLYKDPYAGDRDALVTVMGSFKE